MLLRLRSKLRLQMWLSRSPSGECSVRMRATELPTVPKPMMATFSGLRTDSLALMPALEMDVVSGSCYSFHLKAFLNGCRCGPLGRQC